jgi:hypothetical protein
MPGVESGGLARADLVQLLAAPFAFFLRHDVQIHL